MVVSVNICVWECYIVVGLDYWRYFFQVDLVYDVVIWGDYIYVFECGFGLVDEVEMVVVMMVFYGLVFFEGVFFEFGVFYC